MKKFRSLMLSICFVLLFFGLSWGGAGDLVIEGKQIETTLVFDAGTSVNEFSVDGTLTGNSDDAVPTEKAVKTYADTKADGTHAASHTDGTDDIQNATTAQKGLLTSADWDAFNGKQSAITGTDTHVMFFDGANTPAGEAGMTYNKTTNTLTTTTFVGALTGNASGSSGSCTGNAATCTTASAGDAAVDFFGAGVDAVTDATECTDIEGTKLSITAGTLNCTETDNVIKAVGTTQGDIIYWSGANTPVRLAKGTAAQMLVMNAGATAPEWVAQSGGGDLKADGSVPLTANWDVGAYTLTGTQFISDIAIGTAPFVVTSTTVVTNLNSDTVDGESASAIVTSARVGTSSANLDNADASIEWEDAADLDASGTVTAASTTTAGKIESAIASEVNTGTSTTLAVTPDSLAGSIHGEKTLYVKVIANDTALATGDGKAYVTIPDALNGMNLVDVDCCVYTVSSSGTPTFQVHNLTDTTDMLSTLITIDATEFSSYTAATPPVINTAADDVVTGDRIRLDCDVIGTGTKGWDFILVFQTP